MRFLLPIIVAITATCGAAEMQFIGFIADSKQMLFAVRVEESAPVRWVGIGQSIGGYVVAAYDSKSESLVLRSGDRRISLKLVSASAADLLRQQCASVAASLTVPVEDVMAVAREARDRHKKIIDVVLKTDGSAIEVWLADDQLRESGLTVVFRRSKGQWTEDEHAGAIWEKVEKRPNKAPEPTSGSVTSRASVSSPE